MQRTQLYLDERQVAALDAAAAAKGLTRSDLIRAAIDEYLARNAGPTVERVRAAMHAAFGAWADNEAGVARIAEARAELERRLEENALVGRKQRRK